MRVGIGQPCQSDAAAAAVEPLIAEADLAGRGDGEIVEEPTEPQTRVLGEGAGSAKEEAATEPATTPPADSLFADAPAAQDERAESPTKPISREDREGKTRILSPHRPPAAEDRPVAKDPMADPPVASVASRC